MAMSSCLIICICFFTISIELHARITTLVNLSHEAPVYTKIEKVADDVFVCISILRQFLCIVLDIFRHNISLSEYLIQFAIALCFAAILGR